MTDNEPTVSLVAALRGPVTCVRTANALILSGAAADSADDRLILTFIDPVIADIPDSLPAASVHALDEHHYRITSQSGEMLVQTTSVHVHRDVGKAFYRAVPPRPVPFAKRMFWSLVLALAGSRTGKRVLASLRRKS